MKNNKIIILSLFFLFAGLFIGAEVGLNYVQMRNLFASNDFKIKTRSLSENDLTNTEAESKYFYSSQNLKKEGTALVLMDVWEEYSDSALNERVRENIEEKLLPLLQAARMHKMLVIHAPHGRTINNDVKPEEGEVNLDDEQIQSAEQFRLFLKKRNIHSLIYAGYTTNYCVMFRPEGLINMSKLGFNTLLVRDATLASEFPDTVKDEWMKIASIRMIESQLGKSITVDNFKKAFNESPLARKMATGTHVKEKMTKILSAWGG